MRGGAGTLLLLPLILGGVSPGPAAAGGATAGFFTSDQAVRGRLLFNRHCAYCHAVDAAALSGPGGALVGTRRSRISLGNLLQRTYEGKTTYPSAFYLYAKVRSMPAHDVDAVTTDQRVDILAFLLSAQGLPPGDTELTADTGRMKAMVFSEAGFRPLFNGRDFTGWRFLLGPNCTPAPAGCGKTDPSPVFTVADGVISCTGRIHGLMYTAEKYLNFTLRLDYRFERPLDWEGDEELFRGNSGYMLFLTKLQIWPKTVTMQGEHRNVLQVTPVDSVVDGAWYDIEAKRRVIRPLGEWNSVEIVSRNGELKGFLNGTLVSSARGHEFKEPGHVGFQSEGAPIQWRNIRVRPE